MIGAGGYAILLKSPKTSEVFKLLYDTSACKLLKKEATIQELAYKLLKKYVPEVCVPRVTYVSTTPYTFRNSQYLCGIGMEYLEPPLDFEESVHMLLGYHEADIDTSWGRSTGEPISFTNPTRGFFASPETLNWIWEQEGSSMTIERLAYLMGKTYSVLIKNSILPIDVEWIWSNGKPCLLDFGLCELENIDPDYFLKDKSSLGLASDFYIPHQGDEGYTDFLRGYYS